MGENALRRAGLEVIPGLHMGAAPSRWRARFLAKNGVTHAVDLRDADTKRPRWPASVQYVNLPLTDGVAPATAALDHVRDEVAQLVETGAIVYLYCRAGVQRTPLVVCAVLMQMGWPLADAHRLLLERQRGMQLTDDHMAVLRGLDGWADTRLAVLVPRTTAPDREAGPRPQEARGARRHGLNAVAAPDA